VTSKVLLHLTLMMMMMMMVVVVVVVVVVAAVVVVVLVVVVVVVVVVVIKYACGLLAELFNGDTKDTLIKYSSKRFG